MNTNVQLQLGLWQATVGVCPTKNGMSSDVKMMINVLNNLLFVQQCLLQYTSVLNTPKHEERWLRLSTNGQHRSLQQGLTWWRCRDLLICWMFTLDQLWHPWPCALWFILSIIAWPNVDSVSEYRRKTFLSNIIW